MKKAFVILLVGLMVLISPLSVWAKELSFESVATKLKNTEPMESNTFLSYFLDGSNVNIGSDSITITYTNEGVTYTTLFTYSDGVISYTFGGDKNSETGQSQALIDNSWIIHMIYVVGLLQGYSEQQMGDWFDNTNEADLNKYGIDATYSTFSDTSMNYYETFQIHINDFNIGSYGNTSTTTDNNTEPVEEKSSTTTTSSDLEAPLSGLWSMECTDFAKESDGEEYKTCTFYYKAKDNLNYIAVEINVNNLSIKDASAKNGFKIINSSNLYLRHSSSAGDNVYYLETPSTLEVNKQYEVMSVKFKKLITSADTSINYYEYLLSCTLVGEYFWDKTGKLTDFDHWDGCADGDGLVSTTPTVNTEKEITNPKTGLVTGLGALVVIGISTCVYIFKKKNVIKKI